MFEGTTLRLPPEKTMAISQPLTSPGLGGWSGMEGGLLGNSPHGGDDGESGEMDGEADNNPSECV